MRQFSVEVKQHDWQQFIIPPHQTYHSPGQINVEGDASSASYFLAAGAIGRGPFAFMEWDAIACKAKLYPGLNDGSKISMGERRIEASGRNSAESLYYAIKLGVTTHTGCCHDTALLYSPKANSIYNIASWRLKKRIDWRLWLPNSKLGTEVEEGADYLHIARSG